MASATLSGSVGRGARNLSTDVKLVQQLLNDRSAVLGIERLNDDGKVGSKTLAAIEAFQRNVVRMSSPDGRIDPRGRTFSLLADARAASVASLPRPASVRDAVPLDFDLDAFFEGLDRQPDLAGSRVAYFDGRRMHVLREGPPYCAPGLRAIVIRESTEMAALQVPKTAQARDGKLLFELLGVGLSCSSALLGWAVVIGSSGAAPITGGASTFLTYLAVGAASASTVQCISALGRSTLEVADPVFLDMIDSEAWYQRTALALDLISLAGGAASVATTVRLALSLRASTGKSMVQVLKGLSRQQRKALAEEAVRLEHPGISNGQLKALVRAGAYPRRFTPLQITVTIRSQLMDAIGAAASFSGSAASGAARQAGELVIGIASSVDAY